MIFRKRKINFIIKIKKLLISNKIFVKIHILICETIHFWNNIKSNHTHNFILDV